MADDIVGRRRTSKRRHRGSSASFGEFGRALQGTLYSKESRAYRYSGREGYPGNEGTYKTMDGLVPFYVSKEESDAEGIYAIAEISEILYLTPDQLRARVASWGIYVVGVRRNERNIPTHLYKPSEFLRDPNEPYLYKGTRLRFYRGTNQREEAGLYTVRELAERYQVPEPVLRNRLAYRGFQPEGITIGTVGGVQPLVLYRPDDTLGLSGHQRRK